MTFGKGWIFVIGSACLCLSIVSCETTGNRGGGEERRAARAGGDASGFLRTDYEPLNKWLDERFNVDYKHMTPELIFDQVPLNDIFYETVNLPSDAPAFNYSNPDVSRRELLREVARHWNLKMSLVQDESGTPTAVKVEG